MTDEEQPSVIDEDDAVIVPAPPVEYLAHVHHAPAPAAPRPPSFQSLSYRRTIIPVLLTTALALFALGASHWFVSEDSMLGMQPPWFFIVLFATGGVALVFGILTMIQVQHLMRAGKR